MPTLRDREPGAWGSRLVLSLSLRMGVSLSVHRHEDKSVHRQGPSGGTVGLRKEGQVLPEPLWQNPDRARGPQVCAGLPGPRAEDGHRGKTAEPLSHSQLLPHKHSEERAIGTEAGPLPCGPSLAGGMESINSFPVTTGCGSKLHKTLYYGIIYLLSSVRRFM